MVSMFSTPPAVETVIPIPEKKGKDARPKGDPLAGGRPLKTPFGTFYTPNITPDKESGMGAWTFEDFRRAMVEEKLRTLRRIIQRFRTRPTRE